METVKGILMTKTGLSSQSAPAGMVKTRRNYPYGYKRKFKFRSFFIPVKQPERCLMHLKSMKS